MATTEKELRRMAKSGMTAAEIADAVGVRPTYIYSACRVLGIQLPRPDQTPEYAEEIVSMLRAGTSLTKACKELSVKYITAYQYLKRSGMIEKRPSLTIKA